MADDGPNRPRGGQTVYTREIADEICRRLAEGEALDTICATPGMPGAATVRAWVVKDWHGFAAEYAHAREAQAHKWADEILRIADDGTNDTYVTDDGREMVNQDVVQRSRLRVDSRKWLLSKILPKQFGEKLDLTHSGTVNLANQTDTELQAKLAQLLAVAGGGGNPDGTATPEGEAQD